MMRWGLKFPISDINRNIYRGRNIQGVVLFLVLNVRTASALHVLNVCGIFEEGDEGHILFFVDLSS